MRLAGPEIDRVGARVDRDDPMGAAIAITGLATDGQGWGTPAQAKASA